MADLRIEFHPNDDGTITCRRFNRISGREVRSITYTRTFRPYCLTSEQEREWNTAVSLID